MNRRHFLATTTLALLSPALRAEILTGQSAKMHGQRDRALWLAAQRLTGVRLARPGDQIQVVFFIDLNCPACAQLWRWFNTPGRRQWATLWIPVAYMNKTSVGRATALLRAPDPYAALAHNFGPGFDQDRRIGALAEADAPTLGERSRIRANTRFWNGIFPSTPLILYRNADGTYWQLLGLYPEPEMSGYFTQLAPTRLSIYTK
jgi:thiol:disulfide interchange protein DsbG